MKRFFTIALVLGLLTTFGLNAPPVSAASLTKLSLASTSVRSGRTLTGYVRIDAAAPAGGTEVTLLSSNAAVATVPASVTVEPGKVTAPLRVTALPVNSDTSVTIQAKFDGVTKSSSITVRAPRLATLSGPTTVSGPTTAKGTIQLDGVAGSAGVVVTLTSNRSTIPLNRTVTVASGRSTANFNMTVNSVTVNTAVTLTAAGGGVTKTRAITVTPANLAPLAFTPTSFTGGKTTKGTVSLYQVAPSGGAAVTLTSSAPGVLPVPASVTVPAGSKSVSFTLTSVSGQPTTSVTVSATYLGATRTAKLTVNAGPVVVTKVTLSPNPVGSQSVVTATVELSGAAPAGGTSVAITTTNSTVFPIGGTVTVPAGLSKLVLTRTTGTVSATTNITVGATANGVSVNSTLTVKPWVLLSLTLSTNTVISYSQVTATATLTGPAPSGGAVVTLTGTAPAALPVPATVTVPGGQSSVSFTLTALKVDYNTQLLIGAAGGTGTDQKSITVVPLQVVAWGSFPSNTRGGLAVSTTITINGPAPAGGAAILISSTVPDVSQVPATIVVPAGTMEGTLTINAAFVQANVDTVISATLGPAATLTRNFQVRPPALDEIDTSTWPTLHKKSYTATVSILGPAYPVTGLDVALSSNSAAVTVPSSVNVPPYASTANFTFTVGTVTQPTYVTIYASYRSVVRTMTIYVVPEGPWDGGWSFNPNWSSDTNISISLTGPAPAGGLPVSVTYGSCITGPATVTVPAGSSSATIPVRGVPVISSKSVDFTVAANGLSATLTANCPVATATLTLGASSVKGGQNVSATVAYNVAAPAGGFTGSVTSDNTSVVPAVPFSIPAGSTSTSVTLSTVAVSSTTAPKVKVTGSLPGPQRTLTVQAPLVSSLSISPTSVDEGDGATGTVTIDSPAPPSGLVINLASNKAAASVALTMTIAGGATSGTFPVTTSNVSALTIATITATLNGANTTAQLTVKDVVTGAEATEEAAAPDPVEATVEPAADSTPAVETTPEPVATEEATPEATESATPGVETPDETSSAADPEATPEAQETPAA